MSDIIVIFMVALVTQLLVITGTVGVLWLKRGWIVDKMTSTMLGGGLM